MNEVRSMWDLWLTTVATVAALVVISLALLAKRKKKQALQDGPILTLASTLAVLGIIFGDDPLIGYSFLGTSMALSVIYAVRGSRKK
jgi:hypothetical protein